MAATPPVAPPKLKKTGKTLRATKTTFSLQKLLKEANVVVPPFADPSLGSSGPTPTSPDSLNRSQKDTIHSPKDQDGSTNNKTSTSQGDYEQYSFERALPDADSVATALEASYLSSPKPLKHYSDLLDERALAWAVLAIHSPWSKVETSLRALVAASLASDVFSSLPADIAHNILERTISIATPSSYLYLLQQQRSFLDGGKEKELISDYNAKSKWPSSDAYDNWKLSEQKRIESMNKKVPGEATVVNMPAPIFLLEFSQARHLAKDKSAQPKHIHIQCQIEQKSGRLEKHKTNTVKAGDYNTTTSLEAAPIVISYALPDASKKGKVIASEDELVEYWKKDQATLAIKLKNETGTTIGKYRVPLHELLEKKRGNKLDSWNMEWLLMGSVSAPEVSFKSVVVISQDHLRLDDLAVSICTTYSRLSNRIAMASEKTKASVNMEEILASFAALFGVLSNRVQLASLESHLLYTETALALEDMAKLLDTLDEVKAQKKSKAGELPFTKAELALYDQLRPSIKHFASILIMKNHESFPDNFPIGALKRAIGIYEKVDKSKPLSEAVSCLLLVGAKKAFYEALYPGRRFDERALKAEIEKGKDEPLPEPPHTFYNVANAMNLAKERVIAQESHFAQDFKDAAGVNSIELLVGLFSELLAQAIESYFSHGSGRELHREMKRSGHQTDAPEDDTAEHKCVFQSVDTLRWIMQHWQKYSKKDLKQLLPIYDHLEHGAHWWLESLSTQLLRWAAEVILLDDFEPIDSRLGLLHSQSVVHLFSISHEALGVITPVFAKWTKPTVFDHLEYFVRGFCKSAEIYCANVEVVFTQQTSVEKDKSRVPSSANAHRASVEGRKRNTAPVAIPSLFSPLVHSSKFSQFTNRVNLLLRITEDPSQLLPADQRYTVTQRLCVQMNNVDIVRTLLNERADVLYDLYNEIYEDTMKPIKNGEDLRPPKEDKEDWINTRFQPCLLSIRSIAQGLLNEICNGLNPFIEAMLYFILRMYRDPNDSKVRNEGNRIMSKITSKAHVSSDEVSEELEPVFEFLDSTVEILSSNLYYAVFKRFLRHLWSDGIATMLEDALLPHHEKHLMKPEQVSKFLLMEAYLKEYFCADGESLPASIAEETLLTHQMVCASLTKSTTEVIETIHTHKDSENLVRLLTRLLRLRADNKDAAARKYCDSLDAPRTARNASAPPTTTSNGKAAAPTNYRASPFGRSSLGP